MSHSVSEMERVHLLLRLRNLVELKYSEDTEDIPKTLDSQIIEILNQIRTIEYYIW